MAQRKRTVNKTEEVNEEKEITLTPEALKSLVDQMVEEKLRAEEGTTYTDRKPESTTNENLKELINTLREKDGGRRTILKYDYEVDKEDYMNEEKFFFSYHFSYHIFGDVRFGHQVQTPYKRPIEFKPLYRYKQKGNSLANGRMVSVSMARIRSQKEYDFLMKHSLFGIKFFETQGGATDINKGEADKLADIAAQFSSMNEHSIITRAKQEGIDIDTIEVEDIKRKLILHLANKAGFYKKPERVKPVDSDWTPNRLDEVVEKNSY